MNLELELTKAQIALSLEMQCRNALTADLADAQLKIKELTAKLTAPTPVAPS